MLGIVFLLQSEHEGAEKHTFVAAFSFVFFEGCFQLYFVLFQLCFVFVLKQHLCFFVLGTVLPT